MNAALFRHTWRAQLPKLAVVSLSIGLWGLLMPIIYAEFGVQFEALMESGIIPEQFAQFAGGDVFSLSGSIALGLLHPIALVLNSVFAVGFAASSVAGERQRGTLEVLLARPLSRRGAYVTLLLASLLFVAVVAAAFVVGSVAGAAAGGVLDQLALERLPLVWLNGFLLFGAIATIGLAASVSFDRLTPALAITLAVVVVTYFFEVLGTLWPDAEGLQPYSLFHYLRPKAVLEGTADPVWFVLLAGVGAAAIFVALVVFPRRDLAAPA